MPMSRRQFGAVLGVAALGAVAGGASWQLAQGWATAPGSPSPGGSVESGTARTTAKSAVTERASLVGHGARVLFQGDSVTDAGRDRAVLKPNSRAGLGRGYAWMAASAYLTSQPAQELAFFNRGVSGNTVPDLQRRWDAETVALAPDVVSILIGVNDYWNRHRVRGFKGSPDTYHADLVKLVATTVGALPGAAVVICEPHLLLAGPVTPAWQRDFDGYRQAAADVALAHEMRFVGFQSALEAGLELAPAAFWAHDGIHPTAEGARLMAREWVRVVGA